MSGCPVNRSKLYSNCPEINRNCYKGLLCPFGIYILFFRKWKVSRGWQCHNISLIINFHRFVGHLGNDSISFHKHLWLLSENDLQLLFVIFFFWKLRSLCGGSNFLLKSHTVNRNSQFLLLHNFWQFCAIVSLDFSKKHGVLWKFKFPAKKIENCKDD